MLMKDGTASQTARSVAAHRLEFERVAADYGDRAADRSLTADVRTGSSPAVAGCTSTCGRGRPSSTARW